jgi:hypothetical protein
MTNFKGGSVRFWWGVVWVLAFTLAGCSKEPSAKPVPVKGKLLSADGQPVANMVLTFHPQEDANKTNSPQGVTDKDGAFHCDCLPGKYKVTVVPVPTRHGTIAEGPAPGRENLPESAMLFEEYRSPQTSSLEVTVPPEGKNDVELRLKR